MPAASARTAARTPATSTPWSPMRSSSAPPVGELHHEVRPPVVGLPDVVDRDHVRAPDPAQESRFGYEAVTNQRIGGKLLGENLDGDPSVEDLVVGEHDDAEPADAEQGLDLIPADPVGQAVHERP